MQALMFLASFLTFETIEELTNLANMQQLKRDEAIDKERDLLEGKWKIVSMIINGKEQTGLKNVEFVIELDQFPVSTLRMGKADAYGINKPFMIDPANKLKHFDLGRTPESSQPSTSTDGTSGSSASSGTTASSSSGSTGAATDAHFVNSPHRFQKGIYEMKGDELTIVLPPEMVKVPTSPDAAKNPPREPSPEIFDRPKSFDAKAGSGRTLFKLRRIKE